MVDLADYRKLNVAESNKKTQIPLETNPRNQRNQYFSVSLQHKKFTENMKQNYSIEEMIEDSVFIIRKFAQEFHISWREAFNYLFRFKGLVFLQKHYGYEHTQPPYRTVEALADVCRKNGGTLAL